MKEKLEQLKSDALSAVENSDSLQLLEEIRVKYLGKKGEITAILKSMGSLSAEERPIVGQMANEVRSAIDAAITEKSEIIEKKEQEAKLAAESIDVTLPANTYGIVIMQSENENKTITLKSGSYSLA